jgi:hypothetical protein
MQVLLLFGTQAARQRGYLTQLVPLQYGKCFEGLLVPNDSKNPVLNRSGPKAHDRRQVYSLLQACAGCRRQGALHSINEG